MKLLSRVLIWNRSKDDEKGRPLKKKKGKKKKNGNLALYGTGAEPIFKVHC